MDLPVRNLIFATNLPPVIPHWRIAAALQDNETVMFDNELWEDFEMEEDEDYADDELELEFVRQEGFMRELLGSNSTALYECTYACTYADD